jgi:excisionase family DNA binding protein
MRQRQTKAAAAQRLSPSFTIAEVADILGVSKSTVRRWISAGLIPSYRIAQAHFVRADALEAIQAPGAPKGGAA